MFRSKPSARGRIGSDGESGKPSPQSRPDDRVLRTPEGPQDEAVTSPSSWSATRSMGSGLHGPSSGDPRDLLQRRGVLEARKVAGVLVEEPGADGPPQDLGAPGLGQVAHESDLVGS